MNDFLNNEFEKLKRPKIVISDNIILISDSPFAMKIFLAIFFSILTVGATFFEESYNKSLGIIVCLIFTVIFVYDALSLKRVKIDLREKILYYSSLNPVENLVNYLLKHPYKIPFANIEKIYHDYNESVAPVSKKYYVYIRTDDPYNLKIGTFNKESDAEAFSTYLKREIM